MPKRWQKRNVLILQELPENPILGIYFKTDLSLIIYANKLHPKWLTFHVNGSNASKLSDNINRNKTSLKNCIPTAL